MALPSIPMLSGWVPQVILDNQYLSALTILVCFFVFSKIVVWISQNVLLKFTKKKEDKNRAPVFEPGAFS